MRAGCSCRLGQILDQYHLHRMILHDVAVTVDSHRMLCVGTLTASVDGLQPKKSRAEKQIIGQSRDNSPCPTFWLTSLPPIYQYTI